MPTSFSWLTPESQAQIRGIIEGLIPSWPSGPRPFQVEACSYVLEKIPLILIASTASGKTSTFFTALLIFKYLKSNPHPDIPTEVPPKPVVLVVTPLIELGNNHVD
ncbi:hypothetical protein H1R20_g15829, partial [Candolleomyces eurysporus]